MFDFYRDGQPIAVSIFEKAINDDKLSHAYLIDTNNYSKAYELVLSFVKSIVCLNIEDKDVINNICHRIDNGNYTELKVIESDGTWIKKDQMVDLQDTFSLKGIEGSRRIYIIKDCDKMNVQTSNSILKFLEEPDDNIIAILMTSNVSKLLDTIVSRCQFIRFNSDKINSDNALSNLCNLICVSSSEKEKFLNTEDNKFLIVNFINFVNKFEEIGTGVIVDIKKIWHDCFDNRDKVDIAIDLWINLYYDVLLLKNIKDIVFFIDYYDDVKKVNELNSYDNILRKLEILLDVKSYLKFNLNLNLFIDKLVIDLVGDV